MAMNRDMMAKLAQMQERLAKAQSDLAEKRAEGSSGGGAVHIGVTGGMKGGSLKIDKEDRDPRDVEKLEELLTAPLNQELPKVHALQMGQLARPAGSPRI